MLSAEETHQTHLQFGKGFGELGRQGREEE